MKAIQIETFGRPAEVLKAVDIPDVGAPTWAERIKTDAPWVRPLPPGDINQFAMMGVNPPTAYLLLTDIVKLPRGSWVIQNGANSGVGRATVAIAKSVGLRTVNVVRREEVVAEIKALGGDVVLVDGPLSVAVRAAADAGSRSALLRDDERRHLSGDQPAGRHIDLQLSRPVCGQHGAPDRADNRARPVPQLE